MHRKARVLVNDKLAGILSEKENEQYSFQYIDGYWGDPVSLTLPIKNIAYEFKHFPTFFEGLLPEGVMLEALLRKYKIDSNDLFGQFIVIGQDVVGNISVEEIP